MAETESKSKEKLEKLKIRIWREIMILRTMTVTGIIMLFMLYAWTNSGTFPLSFAQKIAFVYGSVLVLFAVHMYYMIYIKLPKLEKQLKVGKE